MQYFIRIYTYVAQFEYNYIYAVMNGKIMLTRVSYQVQQRTLSYFSISSEHYFAEQDSLYNLAELLQVQLEETVNVVATMTLKRVDC